MNIPLTERCVLLTGAGGSIGSALAKEIIRHRPRSLILLDHSEGNLHRINFDLSALPGDHVLSPIVGDICDGPLLTEIFEERKPETIFHAAAFKHVSLMESNLIPAAQNNALGTYFLAQRARMHDVATFVMVSTDKAVNPHSVMGVSKRLAELALLRWGSPRTSMRAVRLGNVLGSQGSVVPLFLQQIATGGPVTVTHPEVNRYFTSLDEAVELVLLAASLDGESGIFIPNPGEPVRILELAERMIKEAGFVHGSEMPIVMTGLRPGDKMSEEFVSESEAVDAASTAKLRLIKSPQPAQEEFDSLMKELEEKVGRRDLVGVLERLFIVRRLPVLSCHSPRVGVSVCIRDTARSSALVRAQEETESAQVRRPPSDIIVCRFGASHAERDSWLSFSDVPYQRPPRRVKYGHAIRG